MNLLEVELNNSVMIGLTILFQNHGNRIFGKR